MSSNLCIDQSKQDKWIGVSHTHSYSLEHENGTTQVTKAKVGIVTEFQSKDAFSSKFAIYRLLLSIIQFSPNYCETLCSIKALRSIGSINSSPTPANALDCCCIRFIVSCSFTLNLVIVACGYVYNSDHKDLFLFAGFESLYRWLTCSSVGNP